MFFTPYLSPSFLSSFREFHGLRLNNKFAFRSFFLLLTISETTATLTWDPFCKVVIVKPIGGYLHRLIGRYLGLTWVIPANRAKSHL